MLRMLGGWVCGLKSECPSRWAFLSSPTVCSRSWHVDGASVGPWLSDFQLGRFRQGHVPLSSGIFHAFPAQGWEELPTGTVHSSHTYLIAIHPSPAWTRLTSRAFQSIDVESWILLRKKKYYFHLQPLEGFESASWFYYCQQTDFKNKNRKLIIDGMKVCQDEGQAYDIKWDPYTGKPVANVCHWKFWKVAGRGTMFRLYRNASIHSSSFSKSCFQQGKHHFHTISNFLCV